MAPRSKREGLIYLRRSDGRQELSLKAQLDWALQEAAAHGVEVGVNAADLEHMRIHQLHTYKSLRLDDAITGADMTRPGFLALTADALKNRDVSHIFINFRDRFARPEEAAQMLTVEKQLRHAGITLVFSRKVALPCERGQPNLAEDLAVLLEYYESGEFLRKLAERVITAQQQLATAGFRTGGDPPYGFARFLIGPDGKIKEELPAGRRVREQGCHVRTMPKDQDKIKVWILMLDLKKRGWGGKRIARHLNALGIPSPNAGRSRTDHGIRHLVSGKWGDRTVLELCRNRAILGLQEYGRRAEGEHRRAGADGARLLTDEDRNDAGKPKLIHNHRDVVVTAETGGPSLYSPEDWEQIQNETDRRGQSQRGISRASDPGKYPLSCRVIDMTDNCGSVMYGRTSGKRRLYVCGKYMSTAGAKCENNAIDAEALLKLTLTTLRQIVDRGVSRDRLRELLRQLAEADLANANCDPAGDIKALEARRESLATDMETAGRRMAVERDEARYEFVAAEFDRLKGQLQAVDNELSKRIRETMAKVSVDEEVNRAEALLDNIERIASDSAARAEVHEMAKGIGLTIGLTFAAGIKGKKRHVRRLLGGVMVFGDQELPVKLHGRDRIEEYSDEQDTGPDPQVGKNHKKKVTDGEGNVSAGIDVSAPSPLMVSRPEGVSFTKVNRGDWI